MHLPQLARTALTPPIPTEELQKRSSPAPRLVRRRRRRKRRRGRPEAPPTPAGSSAWRPTCRALGPAPSLGQSRSALLAARAVPQHGARWRHARSEAGWRQLWWPGCCWPSGGRRWRRRARRARRGRTAASSTSTASKGRTWCRRTARCRSGRTRAVSGGGAGCGRRGAVWRRVAACGGGPPSRRRCGAPVRPRARC